MTLNEFLQKHNRLNIPHIIIEEVPNERMVTEFMRYTHKELGLNHFMFLIQRPFTDIHENDEFDTIINSDNMSVLGKGKFKIVRTFVRSSPKIDYIPNGNNGIILLSVPEHLSGLFATSPQRIALINSLSISV